MNGPRLGSCRRCGNLRELVGICAACYPRDGGRVFLSPVQEVLIERLALEQEAAPEPFLREVIDRYLKENEAEIPDCYLRVGDLVLYRMDDAEAETAVRPLARGELYRLLDLLDPAEFVWDAAIRDDEKAEEVALISRVQAITRRALWLMEQEQRAVYGDDPFDWEYPQDAALYVEVRFGDRLAYLRPPRPPRAPA